MACDVVYFTWIYQTSFVPIVRQDVHHQRLFRWLSSFMLFSMATIVHSYVWYFNANVGALSTQNICLSLPAYAVWWEGNVFSISVCPWGGGGLVWCQVRFWDLVGGGARVGGTTPAPPPNFFWKFFLEKWGDLFLALEVNLKVNPEAGAWAVRLLRSSRRTVL